MVQRKPRTIHIVGEYRLNPLDYHFQLLQGRVFGYEKFKFNVLRNTYRTDKVLYPGYDQFLNGLAHEKAIGELICKGMTTADDFVLITDPLSCNIRVLRYLMNLQGIYLTFIAYWGDVHEMLQDTFWANEISEISKLYEANWVIRNSIAEPDRVKFNGVELDAVLMPESRYNSKSIPEKEDIVLLLEDINDFWFDLLAKEYPEWTFKKMYGKDGLNKEMLLKEFERAKVCMSFNPGKSTVQYYNFYEALRRGCRPLIGKNAYTEKLFPKKYLVDFEKLKVLNYPDTKFLFTLRKRARLYPLIKEAMESDVNECTKSASRIGKYFFDTDIFIKYIKNKNGRKLIMGGKISTKRPGKLRR